MYVISPYSFASTSYGVFLLALLIHFIIFFLVFEAYGISVTPGGPAPGLVRTISCLCGCLGRCHRKRPYAMYTPDLVSARVLRQPTALDRGKELLHHREGGPRYDL